MTESSLTAPSAPEPVVTSNTWFKTYRSNQHELIWDVLVADDGGYFLVGMASRQFGSGMQEDVYLLRTDAAGKVLWEKTYEGEGAEGGRTIFQTDDGDDDRGLDDFLWC